MFSLFGCCPECPFPLLQSIFETSTSFSNVAVVTSEEVRRQCHPHLGLSDHKKLSFSKFKIKMKKHTLNVSIVNSHLFLARVLFPIEMNSFSFLKAYLVNKI